MLPSALFSIATLAFECPLGFKATSDSQVEVFHIHDFGSKPEAAETIHKQVSQLFSSLDAGFDGNAKFTIVAPVDKKDAWNGDHFSFSCGDALVTQGSYCSEDEIDPTKAEEAFDLALEAISIPSHYLGSKERMNIFDPIYHQLNEWAKEGSATKDGLKTIRIISVSTSACPLVSGQGTQVPSKLQAFWKMNRHVPLTLPTDLMMCAAHDYPSVEDISTLAAKHDVTFLLMINADDDEPCQDSAQTSSQIHTTVKNWWLSGFGGDLSNAGVKGVGLDTSDPSGFEDFMDKIHAGVTSLVCEDERTPVTTIAPGVTRTSSHPSPSLTKRVEVAGSTKTGLSTKSQTFPQNLSHLSTTPSPQSKMTTHRMQTSASGSITKMRRGRPTVTEPAAGLTTDTKMTKNGKSSIIGMTTVPSKPVTGVTTATIDDQSHSTVTIPAMTSTDVVMKEDGDSTD